MNSIKHINFYNSPLGELLIAANDKALCGLWLNDQKYYAKSLKGEYTEADNKIILDTKRWLDIYFSGKEPDFNVPVEFDGSDFQKEVWSILETIPYGKTITYKDIAEIIAKQRGIAKMSAQAVGGAVGKNNISIIVPCHRVIGSDGSLTGYAGGLDRKKFLLELENIVL